MCERIKGRTEGKGRKDGSIRLSSSAAAELRKALRQMDLLLETRGVEPGLSSLVAMLRHLQILRSVVWPRPGNDVG